MAVWMRFRNLQLGVLWLASASLVAGEYLTLPEAMQRDRENAREVGASDAEDRPGTGRE